MQLPSGDPVRNIRVSSAVVRLCFRSALRMSLGRPLALLLRKCSPRVSVTAVHYIALHLGFLPPMSKIPRNPNNRPAQLILA
jgi:hypothetical protein